MFTSRSNINNETFNSQTVKKKSCTNKAQRANMMLLREGKKGRERKMELVTLDNVKRDTR